MPRESLSPVEVAHLGGGTLLVLNYAVLIPGVLPTLAIAGVLTVVVVAPVVVLGLAAAIIFGPPYALWRLISRGRR